jgi:hypothetical protein
MAVARASAGIEAIDGAPGLRHRRRVGPGFPLRAGVFVAALGAIAFAGVSLQRTSSPPAGAGHLWPRYGSTLLSPALTATASTSIGASERAFWPVGHGTTFVTDGGGIHTAFTAAGERLHVDGGELDFASAAVVRGDSSVPVAPVVPHRSANAVLYRHPAITEQYRNGPYGLEQTFIVPRPIDGRGAVAVVFGIHGPLHARQAGSQVLFTGASGATALQYSQLSAFDASGRRLPARIELWHGAIRLQVDDSHARYPIRIDPFIQQGSKLVGSGSIGESLQGESVALSADGNTALVGGSSDNKGVGAVWVYTRSGSSWTQQGPKLKASGAGLIGFGGRIALSADGNMALIAIAGESCFGGCVLVFTRSGSTWTQQPGKLTGEGEVGQGGFGEVIAMSADESTAVIGAGGDGTPPGGGISTGAAWIFTRSGSTWTEQGPKLTGAGEVGNGSFGGAAAISADGNTVLIGGRSDNAFTGAAWVFTRSGSNWTQQGPKLLPNDESSAKKSQFGRPLALSADGNTALMGGISDGISGNLTPGAAWVFMRSGSTWSQQGPKLQPSGESTQFSGGLALSSDGNTAVFGGRVDRRGGTFGSTAPGAWVFGRSGSTWSQLGPKLTVSDGGVNREGGTGESFAMSADGSTFLLGNGGDNLTVGAAWAFAADGSVPPTVTGIAPAAGTTLGGTRVTIEGSGFLAGATVRIGTEVAAVNVVSETDIVATTAAAAAGSDEVVVTDSRGTSTGGPSFSYAAPPLPTVTNVLPNLGPVAGGTAVTITGTNLSGASAVTFGSTAAPSFSVNAAGTESVAESPPGAGTVDVTVTANGATSATSAADEFTYVARPVVAAVGPTAGAESGGTNVTIAGTNLAGATLVRFGSASAASFSINPAGTAIEAESPAGTGVVDVTIVTPGGTSAISSGDQFSYVPAPSVVSVSPGVGPEAGGTSVTVTGTNLTGASAVRFGTAAATGVVVNSSTSLTAEAPAGTGVADVTVTTPGGASMTTAADQFTYVAVPVVTELTPSTGPASGGTIVSIAGANLTGATAVRFGSVSAGFSVNLAGTAITAEAPPGTGLVDVTVATAGGVSALTATDQFAYVPAPTVSGVNPGAGPESGGTIVAISGTGLAGATAVKFGSTGAIDFSVNQAGTLVTAESPPGTGVTDVTVSTIGGMSVSSEADRFSYVPAPGVSGVAPASGPESGGTQVTITGTNLTEASTVEFGATAAGGVVVNSPTSLTAEAPAGTGMVDITVTTPGGTSATTPADHFIYVPAPTVSEVKPAAGPTTGGTSVTIAGAHLSGVSAVRFGASEVLGFSVNPAGTEITAQSPPGSGVVDVTVTTVGGTSATLAADQFTYVQQPVVTGVSPVAGPLAGNTSVTITGTALTGASAVSFGAKAALSFSVNPAGTAITASSPPGTGTVDVTVTTIGGTSATGPADRFAYLPTPSVSKVAPSSGPAAGSTAVTITGTNLSAASAVKFGAANAMGFAVNGAGTSIIATSPPGTGTVDVRVTTPGGVSALSAADQFSYLPPPTITKLKPTSGPAAGLT